MPGFVISCGNRSYDLDSRTHIMGILNVTPDSFSDGGSFLDPGRAVEHAARMLEEGADFIDIGGESTRPGADSVPQDEELRRIIPVIERVVQETGATVSVDTCKAEVAKRAIDAGASMVNDISGLFFDSNMAGVVSKAGCPVVLMHIKGRPSNMQDKPSYDFLLEEVSEYLGESIAKAEEAGIKRKNIIIDPGIGFGKRIEDNITLIRELEQLKTLACPILVGVSRKSFIGHLLGGSGVDERLEGSIAAGLVATAKGAAILRVHDVKETKKALLVSDALIK